MSPRIKIEAEGRVLEAPFEARLGDVLVQAGIPISLYCGRRGVCGKCAVEVLSGDLPPLDERERILLESRRLPPDRFRLACRLPVRGDLTIRIPESSFIPSTRILARGEGKSVRLDPSVRKIAGRRSDIPGASAVSEELRAEKFPDDILTTVLGPGDEVLALEREDTTSRLFGLAIDLGTTTLVVDLVDLRSGAVIATAVGLNGQSSFGADVVSRITAAFRNPGQAEALRRAVLASLNGLIAEVGRTGSVQADEIYETVIAGNTAMGQLFLGLPIDGLAVAPFEIDDLSPSPIPASTSGLTVNPAGRVVLAPHLHSFVGGDITAGLLALDLPSRSGNILFLDLGTNGELVLKTDRGLTATSTAAGPAFEGMSLSCGLPAQSGAIDKAVWDPDEGCLIVQTIGPGPARGVCGTGLVDVIAAFLRRGSLNSQGRILHPDKRLTMTPDLALLPSDIREVQLAAAAVKTGLRMLLAAEDLEIGDLDQVFVAGAFGASLDVENAVRIGLLPRLPEGRIRFVGNTSLEGARAMLLSRAERRLAVRIAGQVGHLPLAQDEAFQRMFVDALEFREWPDADRHP
jgi:uncharacterized 2Fe-2S/4Fe-4S cluster protein (DUF4445 family)